MSMKPANILDQLFDIARLPPTTAVIEHTRNTCRSGRQQYQQRMLVISGMMIVASLINSGIMRAVHDDMLRLALTLPFMGMLAAGILIAWNCAMNIMDYTEAMEGMAPTELSLDGASYNAAAQRYLQQVTDQGRMPTVAEAQLLERTAATT